MKKWSLCRVSSWLALCLSFSFFSANAFSAPNIANGCLTIPLGECMLDGPGVSCVQPGTDPLPAGWNVRANCTNLPNSGPPQYLYPYWISKWDELCPDGTVPNETTYLCEPPPCLDTAGESINSSFGYYYFSVGPSDFGPNPVGCFDGCKYSVDNGFQGPMPFGAGFMLVATKMTGVGAECGGALTVTIIPQADIPSVPPEDDPDSNGEPEGPSDCPPGTGFAQVNNSNMCLPSGTSGSGPTTTSSSSSTTTYTDPVTGETVTTGGSGGVVTSSTSTWTINGDGTVTTTTNNTVDYGNGETSGSSTTSTGGVAGVTSGSGGSGSSGSGSGSGGSGGSGGDDINFGPPPTWTDPGNGGDIQDLTIGQLGEIDIHQEFLPEGGECALEDIPLEVMGISISIPLSSACPYFPYVYGLVVFMSALASIRLFAMAPW